MEYYPIAVKLKNHVIIVVGGGSVAQRKSMALLEAGARLTIISPGLTGKLRDVYRKGGLRWIPRRVKKSDVRNATLVIAATNNNDTNLRVSRWAKEKRIWINAVDQPAISDFISVAFERTGGAILSVYTDGRNPELSRDVKNFLKEHWNDFLSYRNKL